MFNFTFGKKIFLAIVGVSVLIAVIISVPAVLNLAKGMEEFSIQKVRSDANMVAAMSTPAVIFGADDLALEILKLLDETDNFVSAAIYVPSAQSGPLRLYASYGEILNSNLYRSDIPAKSDIHLQAIGNRVQASAGIYSEQDLVGMLQIVVDLTEVRRFVSQALWYVAGAFVIALLIASYLANTFRRILVKPINDLNETAKEIAHTKNYSRRALRSNDDEVGDLIQSFNEMLSVIERFDLDRKAKADEVIQLNQNLEKNVQDRTMELQSNMEMLEQTVQDLKTAQSKLVEQEKMASLGGLVSGVAHEINTPIGVAITASSHLSQNLAELSSAFDRGNLTRRLFFDALGDLIETNTMVKNNLERAAQLVKSFKLVAVDQSNEDVREFNIKEYIETVLTSLAPKIKRTSHRVVLEAPADLAIYSSPGALSQIITNLVINSLQHGFEAEENGSILIRVVDNGGIVRLDYFDNGSGVSPEIAPKIFDPFVTSARHKGGSGLGTHILYNLVNQVLGGTVALVDDVSQGVHFVIEFPSQIPDPSLQNDPAGRI